MQQLLIIFLLLLSDNVIAQYKKTLPAPGCVEQQEQKPKWPNSARVAYLSAKAVDPCLYYRAYANNKNSCTRIITKAHDCQYGLTTEIEYDRLAMHVWERPS